LKLRWPPRSCVPVAMGRRYGSLRRMGELDLATVAAANDAWVLAPEGSEVVETAEYRLVRFPERFADPLQMQWVRSAWPAEAVLGEVVARAVGFGLPEAYVYVKLSAPDGFDEALLGCGAQLVDTSDVLAMALPADVKAPDLPRLEVRWRTAPEVARDANTVGISTSVGAGPPTTRSPGRRRPTAIRSPRGPEGPSSLTSTAPRSESRASRLPTAWPGCGAAECWRRTAAAASTVAWLPLA
jgi:hypothetical protein